MVITRRSLVVGATSASFFISPLDLTSRSARAEGTPNLIKEVQDLEGIADEKKLPIDQTISRSGSKLNDQNLYIEGLPRVVVLADRADLGNDPALASQVGDLLSSLNRLQHETPDRFKTSPRAPAPTFDSVRDQYGKMFAACQIAQKYAPVVKWHTAVLRKYEGRYRDVETKTKVPWYFIGVLHALEASFNFRGHLHNGDPLSSRTTHVPAGRPKTWLPPTDWAASAVDALTVMGFTDFKTWSLEEMLYRWEAYNGFGYRSHKVNSPYLWSFSDQYTRGKYTSDGKFSRTAVSQQCGAAVMLKALVNAKVVTLE